MSGQNEVYFVAYDNQGASAESRWLDLRIDLAAPATTASLNGEANPAAWPAWSTAPVTVRLHAEDGATGRARSGVSQVRYRLDGGGWQSVSGSDASFAVNTDGQHSVEFYAVDNVGNAEASRTVAFQIDQTPPSPLSGVGETHGAPKDQWQRDQNIPAFTWAASTDAMSGVWGYQLYFGADPAGQAYQTFLAGDPRQWTPLPAGVRTGAYYLRGRARDVAGNWTGWQTVFIFRYDGAPPENPSGVTHRTPGVANDTWQRLTSTADFTWPTPHDEGSGIQGYYVYWGADPAGTSSSLITASQYQAPGPLCGPNDACTGYLRLRSQDNVANQAEEWSTGFVLRFDNQPPTADFTFNNGVTQTAQTLVTLDITASDGDGSGLQAMRLSGDGQNWMPWEVPASQRLWTVPAISRRWWPVYLQVRDNVGLESEVISHTVYLDVNPAQPRSASFRLFDNAMSAGAGRHTSPDYQGRSTVGQVADAARAASLNYRLVGGYQAGSQALPLIEPQHDEFILINGIFASGTGGRTLTSPSFSLVGTLGEPGLPNNQTTLSSQNHVHQPGFLAAAQPTPSPTATPPPGPTPTPPPTPACAFPTISIDNGAEFTNDLDVTLSLCAPYAVEMMISNDENFTGASWEPFAATKPWTILAAGQLVAPRFVYAAFRNPDGSIQDTYFDDIIYDPNAPSGSISTDESGLPGGAQAAAKAGDGEQPSAVVYVQEVAGVKLAQPMALLSPQSDGTVDMYINAQDDNSSLSELQLSASPAFTDTTWQPYSALAPWTPTDGDGTKTVYARFRDNAGNVSPTANTSFQLDTLPPLGGIAMSPRIVGQDTMTTTVYLGAEDNLSGVSDMRISADPSFEAAPWQPYTTTLTWPISLTGETEGALYAQYRDLAGNASQVYSDTYTVDTAPPVVYVEVAPGETLNRTVNVWAYDELADLSLMRLTNDPLFVDAVVTMPYTDAVTWDFDERRVIWVQVKDAVGNWSEPYPAYAAEVFAPLAPAIMVEQQDAGPQLTWTHLSANVSYEVWRSADPYFDPSIAPSGGELLETVYPPGDGSPVVFTDTTNDPNVNAYYLVRGVNALRQASPISNRIGVFRFGLVPGTTNAAASPKEPPPKD